MNKQRRKEIEGAVKLMTDALDVIWRCAEEEDEAYENLPESLMFTDRACEMFEYSTFLIATANDLNEILDILNKTFNFANNQPNQLL